MPKFGKFEKSKRRTRVSPMAHPEWENWAVPGNFKNLASKPKLWLNKMSQNLKRPPAIDLPKPLVDLAQEKLQNAEADNY